MSMIQKRYRVLSELSETGFGCVYECQDMAAPTIDATSNQSPELEIPTSKTVVVKRISLELNSRVWSSTMRDHLPDSPETEREIAMAVRELGGHPNLVHYESTFVEFDNMYLVMEHCTDGDVHSFLSQSASGSLSCMSALSVLSQVASGLRFLHSHGIAHRDISLENIFMDGGRCKLGDFGLATRARRAHGGKHELAGKKYYMAPEVVAGGSYCPKAADVWSLGIVLFILLTGSPLVPLASHNVRAFRAFEKLGVREVLARWELLPEIWDSTVELLEGMLELNPAKRLTIEQVLSHRAFRDWATIFEKTR